jgi:rubrerythrin
MNLLDFAMAIEKEGIEYYTKLANEAVWKEVSDIFMFMAGEDKGHYKILDAWLSRSYPPLPDNSNILKQSKAVFKRLSDRIELYGIPIVNYYSAYEKALRLEEKSVAFYKEALIKIENQDQKEVLIKIIEQEKSHASFLTDLLEFLRRPEEWLENAEWYRLENN